MTGVDWLRPGIYPDLPAEDYHSDPTKDASLSAHIAHILLTRSPKHAWTAHPKLNPDFQRVEEDKFDFGTCTHDLLLRGLDIAHVVDANDWRTKAAQEERDGARNDGLIPLLRKDWERVQRMVEAIREQLPALEVSPPLFADGLPEQSLIWREQDITCRTRVDWLHDDFSAIDDLKTVPSRGGTANPHDWTRRTFWRIGAEIEARFHSRGVKVLTGTMPRFRFLVAEATPPYGLSVVDLAPSVVEFADREIDTAIGRWRECVASGEWPGYETQVASVELDAWQETDFLARHWQPDEEELVA
jgi:hypothetical protein